MENIAEAPVSRRSPFPRPMMLCVAGGLAASLGIGWLARPAPQRTARRVSDAFVRLCREKRLEEAYELTVKTGYVGPSIDDFAARVENENFDPPPTFLYTHPPQTNGNRLRRRMMNRRVGPERLAVEYSGGCLLGVHLLLTKDGDWKVYKFGCHAG